MSLVSLKKVDTEKTHKMQESGEYTFVVPMSSGKNEIKKAITKQFSVNVVSVRTLVMPSRKKYFRGRAGCVAESKKAYVKVASGEKIVFEGSK